MVKKQECPLPQFDENPKGKAYFMLYSFFLFSSLPPVHEQCYRHYTDSFILHLKC